MASTDQTVRSLRGQVAVVAGATRGAGRGIARALGEAGATVYCTGRSVAGRPATAGRPETIEETAALVTAAGGRGIAVRVDHLVDEEVRALFARIAREEARLDLLVNDIYGGHADEEWGKHFWQQDPTRGLRLVERAVHTHILTSRHGAPAMVHAGRGLIIEITDGEEAGYRGNFFYDLAKASVNRLAYAMAHDLRGTGVTALALTPGFLRSEEMLDIFGVKEESWRDGIARDRHFAESETPAFVGRAVVALATDPEVARKAGRAFSSGALAQEYGFRDADGRQPNFPAYFDRAVAEILDRGGPASDDERALVKARYQHLHLDPARAAFTERMRAALGW
jgi:NAD(P)-dependent dehydrogenase (short-subunit alcohol dehydrogenase family)